jgi:hypothetical protein
VQLADKEMENDNLCQSWVIERNRSRGRALGAAGTAVATQ